MMSRPTRSQLRRHARRLARDGYQPMMLVNSGSDLPETVATAIFRAIWRYRSELVPIAVAAAAFIGANTLHSAHHGAWPWLALATLASITALTLPPPAWARKTWAMLDHPAERAYAVAVTAATGGWLTIATAIGPATPPMPAIGRDAHPHMRYPVVGQPSPSRQGPRRPHARSLARDRQCDRPTRIADHVRAGRCLGLARAATPSAWPDHQRRDREDSRARIGTRNVPRSRPRLPDPR